MFQFYNSGSLFRRIIRVAGRGLVIRKLRKLGKIIQTPRDAVDATYSFEFHGHLAIEPRQVKEEIQSLGEFVSLLKPKVVLEIGTSAGGTLFLWCKVSDPNALIISIDLLGGNFGGGYSNWRTRFYLSFGQPNQEIRLIRADSHDDRTLQEVNNILGRKLLDFLFIDGDHTFQGVKRDFEMYSPLVKEGGVIALHDIVRHPREIGCEVDKFWNELKLNYKYKEFVEDWNQGWGGIGLIYI